MSKRIRFILYCLAVLGFLVVIIINFESPDEEYKAALKSKNIADQTTSSYPVLSTEISIEAAQIQRALKPVNSNLVPPSLKSETPTGQIRAYDTVELGKGYALVIGINEYGDDLGKLKTAVNDANEVAKILRDDFDFEVTTLLDVEATRNNIFSQIENIENSVRPEDRVLIYYAGHGELNNDKAFWLPVDADPTSRANWIQSDSLTNLLKGISARHVLVVADSCYSGATSFATAQTPNIDLNVLLQRSARVLITSGGVEPVLDASPNGGGHSIFARAFLRNLKEIPYKTFSARELYEGNLELVYGNAVQRPEFKFLDNSGHDGGIFLMRRSGVKLGVGPKPVVQPTSWLEGQTGMNFRFVKGGCFEMGSDKASTEHRSDELLHRVCVSDFWLADQEVTNAQYLKYKQSHKPSPLEGLRLDLNDHPAVRVSWDDAKAFANWLTRKYGATVNFRLPTEAEWEYACQKGSDQSFEIESPDLCALVSLADQSLEQYSKARRWKKVGCNDGFALTAPSGTFPPNRLGIHDMRGNAWEWVEDFYSVEYSLAVTQDPLHKVGKNKVLRGGSWKSPLTDLRCARRRSMSPELSSEDLGFRLVRTLN